MPARTSSGPRLAAGEPVLDGAVEPDRGENVRPRHPGARLLRAEPRQDGAPARRLDRGLAADPLPRELGRERANPPRPAEVRRHGPVRGRPPHRGLELVHAGSVGLDRQGHPALPRARKRLGRHRLQLPRRQVRPDLRRPIRRSRPERRRRACPGLQHGLVGDRADRDVRRQCAFGRGPQRAGSPHCLATRRRARRSALEIQLALDRQPALPGRPQPHAAHDLRPPRHGLHDLSRKPALRRAARACSDRVPNRAAEALLPRCDRRTRRLRALHRDAHRSAPVVGGGLRAERERRCDRGGDRHGRRLDVGREDGSGRALSATRSTPAPLSGRRPVPSPAPPRRPR